VPQAHLLTQVKLHREVFQAAEAGKRGGPPLSEKTKQQVIDEVKAGRMVPGHLARQLYALAGQDASYKHDPEDPTKMLKAWKACRKVLGLPDAEPQPAIKAAPVSLTADTINELRALVDGVDKPIAVDRLKQKCSIKGSKGKKGIHRNSIRSAMRHFGLEGASANTNLPTYMGALYDKIIETQTQKAEELAANGYKPPVATQGPPAATTQPPAAQPAAQPPAGADPKTTTPPAGPSIDKARAALLGGDKGKEGGSGGTETTAEKQAREAKELAAKLLGKTPAAPPKEEKPAPQPQPAAPAAQPKPQPPVAAPKEEKPAPAAAQPKQQACSGSSSRTAAATCSCTEGREACAGSRTTSSTSGYEGREARTSSGSYMDTTGRCR
jgi:hypothetical protein